MFQSPEYGKTLSLKLSEVLEDIGVNKDMVITRRRTYLLMETLKTIALRLEGYNVIIYHLGSQFEGTTTFGLGSDMDIIILDYNYNVIQDWSEWKHNKINLLMIQDENVTPGYCFLQRLRSDEPLFETNIAGENYIKDNNERILLSNTFRTNYNLENSKRHGPSNAVSGIGGYCDTDNVFAFPCDSWPQITSQFLERPDNMKWLSPESARYAFSYDCLVVGASSKIATYPELEWRISTSIAERCLMLNLNITQLQCYALMKIILKSFIISGKNDALSSFMCKNVLLQCIENTEQNIWKRDNLLTCFTNCMLELHSHVKNEKCQHLIISENNLMAGQFTAEEKRDILQKLCDIIQSDGRCLLRISIGNISQRLQVKLSSIVHFAYSFQTSHEIREECLYAFFILIMETISMCPLHMYLTNDHICDLKQMIFKLKYCCIRGNRLEQLASRLLTPFLCSTLGLILASSSMGQNNSVQYEALKWLSLGLNSDATSGRLKLASLFYCVGDMDRAEFILRQIESRYNSTVVELVCGCWCHPRTSTSAEVNRKCSEMKCSELSENCKNITSFYVKFLQSKVNCVPRELRYEMVRSLLDDMPHVSINQSLWMNFAVVDSLPYLYFLQYKTYDYLQRRQDQQRALNNLAKVIFTGGTFGHRETALNLLGQCIEQEKKPREALKCFMLSLRQRERNNAAKFHICNLLRKYSSNM